MKPDTVSVVISANQAYATPLYVAVASLRRNLRQGVGLDLYVLGDGLEPETRKRLADSWGKRVQVVWISPDNGLLRDVLPEVGYGATPTMYYTLLVGKALPAHLRKVIYLDTDVLVQGDLYDLWQTDMGGKVVLAVQDSSTQTLPLEILGRGNPEGRRTGLPYFNAGLIVYDLAAWRAEGWEQRCLEMARQQRVFTKRYDQDALNACLIGRWGTLPPRWNKQFSLNLSPHWRCSPHTRAEFEEGRRNPAVIHFCTRRKPWQSICDHPEPEETEAFRNVLRQSEWADQCPSPLSTCARAREFLARPHRRLIYTLGILFQTKSKWQAVLFLPSILKLVLTHPWIALSLPLYSIRDFSLRRRIY